MSTAFVFATWVEARPLLETWQAAPLRDVPYELFHAPAADALVAICGMGLDAADAALDHLLEAVRPAEVVNCGIAGALHDRLAIGDLRRIAGVAEAGDIAVGADAFQEMAIDDVPWLPADLHTARLVSRRTPLFEAEVRGRLAATADLVDMEGDRIARRCAAHATRCALLKSVSDHADDRATLLRNLDASSRRLAEFLTRHYRASKPYGAVT